MANVAAAKQKLKKSKVIWIDEKTSEISNNCILIENIGKF